MDLVDESGLVDGFRQANASSHVARLVELESSGSSGHWEDGRDRFRREVLLSADGQRQFLTFLAK